MMNWNYGGMMDGWGGGAWMSIYGIVILVDLILLGLWLWKQLQKK